MNTGRSNRTSPIAQVLAVLVLLLTLTAGPGPQVIYAGGTDAPQPTSYLPVNDGAKITTADLKQMLDQFIPTDNAQSTLLVFTQCYGGEMATAFQGRANTAVLAATESGCSIYQGYHDDAAQALKPGAGRTSDDVHDDASRGKSNTEKPTKAGTPVSLEPVTEDGKIRSRHILVYAGKPEALDVADRDAIQSNFAGRPHTTVTSVGGAADSNGAGQNGWDFPGTAEGLRKALGQISKLMNPHEQFILFVTDHGGRGVVESSPACKNGQCTAPPLPIDELLWQQMFWDLANRPTVVLTSLEPVETPVQVWVNNAAFPNVPFDIPLNLDADDQPDAWQAHVEIPEGLLQPLMAQVSVDFAPTAPVNLASIALDAGALQRPTTVAHGTLATSSGPSIYDFQLRQMIDKYIPTNNAQSTLLVFTQCFAGDMVDDFAGRANTAVLSATAPGQSAYYGGYHDDAAKALRPGAGRTSDDVHSAGVGGKDSREDPSKSGGAVSLEPVTPDGAIRSRHVLVYAGQPNSQDEQDRKDIESNFAGQPNTTVTTVGKDGQGGWDYPATHEGLRKALEEIGKKMNPHEQFILFVTDHGDYDAVDEQPSCNGGFCVTAPLALGVEAYAAMTADSQNQPGITLHLSGGTPPEQAAQVLVGDGSFQALFDRPIDLDGDGLFTGPGEGWQAFVPLHEENIDPTGVIVAVNLPQSRGEAAVGTLEFVALESGEIAKVSAQHRLYLPNVQRQ